MGFLSWILGGSSSRPQPSPKGPDEAILLHFPLEGTWPTQDETAKYHALQDQLDLAVQAAKAGELDGDEWGEGQCVVFLYGPSAALLWDAIAPVLEKYPFPEGSHAIKRQGPPGSSEERIDLTWAG